MAESRLGNFLMNDGLINLEQHTALSKENQGLSAMYAKSILRLKIFKDDATFCQYLSFLTAVPIIKKRIVLADKEGLKILTPELCMKLEILPIEMRESSIKVMMLDPLDKTVIQTLRVISQKRIETTLASAKTLERSLRLIKSSFRLKAPNILPSFFNWNLEKNLEIKVHDTRKTSTPDQDLAEWERLQLLEKSRESRRTKKEDVNKDQNLTEETVSQTPSNNIDEPEKAAVYDNSDSAPVHKDAQSQEAETKTAENEEITKIANNKPESVVENDMGSVSIDESNEKSNINLEEPVSEETKPIEDISSDLGLEEESNLQDSPTPEDNYPMEKISPQKELEAESNLQESLVTEKTKAVDEASITQELENKNTTTTTPEIKAIIEHINYALTTLKLATDQDSAWKTLCSAFQESKFMALQTISADDGSSLKHWKIPIFENIPEEHLKKLTEVTKDEEWKTIEEISSPAIEDGETLLATKAQAKNKSLIFIASIPSEMKGQEKLLKLTHDLVRAYVKI